MESSLGHVAPHLPLALCWRVGRRWQQGCLAQLCGQKSQAVQGQALSKQHLNLLVTSQPCAADRLPTRGLFFSLAFLVSISCSQSWDNDGSFYREWGPKAPVWPGVTALPSALLQAELQAQLKAIARVSQLAR